MNRILLLFVALCTVSLPAAAQITISRADVEAQFGDPVTVTFYVATSANGATAIFNARGANQTWDFTTLEFDDGDSTVVIEPVEPPVPGSSDDDFAQANVILRADPALSDSVLYDFELLSDTALVRLGYYLTSPSLTGALKYQPAFTYLKLPLAFGTRWSYDGRQLVSSGSASISLPMDQTSEVVGWGTLIVPDGSGSRSEEALMVLDTLSVVPLFSSRRDTSYTATFWTKDGPIASIRRDANGFFEEISYRVITRGGVANEPGDELPRTVVLHQNHPNPFNPATTIRYELARPARVTLSIFDAAGREVAVLAVGQQAAGSHEVRWEAANEAGRPLPSGVYLYRVEAVGADGTTVSSARTMVLLK